MQHIKLDKKTRFEILSEVASIKSVEDRTETLRDVCRRDRSITLILQYTYHPDMIFDLPEGDLTESLIDQDSQFMSGGLAYHMNRTDWYQMTKKRPDIKRVRKEMMFQNVYNSIHPQDRKVLIGLKDKKLPWRNLGEKFVMQAVPELFPPQEEAA